MGDSEFKVRSRVPELTITDIKLAPMSGFEKAEEENTGVYITNRKKHVGVMLSVEQYEYLVELEEINNSKINEE